MCVPGSNNSVAYDPILSQILAWQSTNLAIHNADNYAGFALDVFFATRSWMPSPAPKHPKLSNGTDLRLEDLKNTGWIWTKPKEKITSLESVVDRFDTLPTKVAPKNLDVAASSVAWPITCS